MIRVFIVDDSSFVRKALRRSLASAPDIRVVGEAKSAEEALRLVPDADPDVVTLDVAMEGMDGLAALRGLLAWRPSLPVIMLSAHTTQGAAATLEAMSLGAVDVIDKGDFSLMDLDGLGRRAIDKIRLWRQGRRVVTDGAIDDSSLPRGLPDAGGCELCVIGASTGGPPALQRLLEALPPGFPLPVVIAQHMPPGFTRPFAKRLDGLCDLRVKEAADGDRVERGTVLIAPAGRHLRITRRLTVTISDEPADAPHRPSIDLMMTSAAQARPGKVLGILLTGMGDDGADGMAMLRAQGGITIGESEESCVVFGMSRAAHERGAVERLLPLAHIAGWLAGIRPPVPVNGTR